MAESDDESYSESSEDEVSEKLSKVKEWKRIRSHPEKVNVKSQRKVIKIYHLILFNYLNFIR